MKAIDIIKKRKRLFLNRKTSARNRIEIIKRAAEDNYDALVFPFNEKLNAASKFIKLAKKYELAIEAGGCALKGKGDLSLLLPKKLFFFHRDLFRMEQGKRKRSHHFCPTNPQSTALIKENAHRLFSHLMEIVTAPRVFHLMPDKGHENTWCACPACRAFTPFEQYLITVNTAADALAKLDPQARLAYSDYGIDPQEEKERAGISPRANMITLKN